MLKAHSNPNMINKITTGASCICQIYIKYFRKYTYKKSSSCIGTVLDSFYAPFVHDVRVAYEETPEIKIFCFHQNVEIS